MNRFILIVIISITLSPNKLFTQIDYYWNNNQKVYLERIPNKKYLITENISDTTQLKLRIQLVGTKVKEFGNTNVLPSIKCFKGQVRNEKKWSVVEKTNIITDTLTTRLGVVYEAPFFKTRAENEIGLSHLFYVKLFNEGDIGKLEEMAMRNHVEILGSNLFMPLWYTLSCSKQSNGNALLMANTFYESGLFESSEPDWLIQNISLCANTPNDALFNTQWGLENTGQYGGTIGIDIKACQAWQITKGSNNVIVAVVDAGIELNHPDLTNMHPISYDTESLGLFSSSQVWGEHGIACAGIIGAAHNNIGTAGIAPNCPLMSISANWGYQNTPPGLTAKLANGINFAWQNGASVISNSYGHYTTPPSALLNSAISAALTQGRNGLGCIVLFSSGNSNEPVAYPANQTGSNADVLAVGRINYLGQPLASGNGPELDIVGPGYNISTTDIQGALGYDPSDYNVNFGGTSASCPAVAAVAALVLSVNNNLTQQQVNSILLNTAQKIGPVSYSPGYQYGLWNQFMGYGLVDANAAVLMAQSLCTTPALDLFSKDGYKDFGFEPNPAISYSFNPSNYNIYNSPDIWVRNQPDGLINFQSQNPEYSSVNDPSQLNYVYVRIRNRSCVTSSGGLLDLRWSKAATAMTWATDWNGNSYFDPGPNTAQKGALIGLSLIPPIKPGQSEIISFPWNPPNPAIYSALAVNEPWHFCLLSRITHINDPITFSEGSFVADNVLKNNNIAWKNLAVVDNVFEKKIKCPKDIMEGIGTAVSVYNPDRVPAIYNLQFKVPDEEINSSIFQEGKIFIAFDKHLYDLWDLGGKQGSGFHEILPTVNEDSYIISDRKMFEVTDFTVKFNNITLDSNDYAITSIMFIYPTSPVTTKDKFSYSIIQSVNNSTAKSIGGVQFDIHKPNCTSKKTSAGSDITIERGETATLKAKYFDCANHIWLNDQTQIIGKDSTLTISPIKTSEYNLKTVSSEGCYSDAKVKVIVTDPKKAITDISPNPASNDVTIKYKLKNTHSAQLRFVSIDNSFKQNFNLNTPSHQTSINISDFPNGVYALLLICDGTIEDSKTLIIQKN